MKIIKILITSIIITAIGLALGMLLCGGIFNWVYRLEPTDIFKPVEKSLGIYFYLGYFGLSLILSSVFVVLQKGVPGSNRMMKGLNYGLYIWAVGCLPGMFIACYFTSISTVVVIYWTALGLVELSFKGFVIGLICGERGE